jgi:hypothetical protein
VAKFLFISWLEPESPARTIFPFFHFSIFPFFHHSIIPSFHHSIIPFFHFPIIPSFLHSKTTGPVVSIENDKQNLIVIYQPPLKNLLPQ